MNFWTNIDMRKIKRSTQKKKLDKLFSLIIRKNGVCELRGRDDIHCNGNLQCMHIVGRSNYRLRWDILNAICGCAAHHYYYTNHPTEFAMLIEMWMPETYEYLKEHKNELFDGDYDSVEIRLKNLY